MLDILLFALLMLLPFVAVWIIFLRRRKLIKAALGAAPDGEEFTTQQGAQITTVAELAEYLRGMSAEEYGHHVNTEKNDFSAWVGESVGYKELAEKLGQAQSRQEIQGLLDKA